MSRIQRVILDTSTLVSAALRMGSVPDRALLKALRTCDVCASVETLDELARVLDGKKFDRYCDRESRRSFVALIRRSVRLFAVDNADRAAVDPACRDLRETSFWRWRWYPRPMPWAAAMRTCWCCIRGAGYRS